MNRLSQSLNTLRQKSADASMPSTSMLPQYLLFGTLAIALPIVIAFSVQLWMVTMYTSTVDIGRFHEQYFSGVYRYRILGRGQYLFLYQFLEAHFRDRPFPLPRDPATSLLSYAAFAISNSFYFALSNLILLSFMWVKRRGFLDRDLVFYLYYTLLLSLSMAVVTPYDQLAYLLVLVGILGARQRSIAVGSILIAISAIAGTLNRETAFLVASFLATMAIVSPALLAKRYWIYLAVDIVLSIGVYVALRLLLPGKVALIQYVTLGGIWAPESLAVLIVIFAGAIVFAMKLHHNIRPAFVLLAMSLPYLTTIFIGSSFRELRISIPILLCLFCVYLFLSRAPEVSVDEGGRVTVG